MMKQTQKTRISQNTVKNTNYNNVNQENKLIGQNSVKNTNNNNIKKTNSNWQEQF